MSPFGQTTPMACAMCMANLQESRRLHLLEMENEQLRNEMWMLRQDNQVLNNLNADWEEKVVGYAKALVDWEAKAAENARALVVNEQRLSKALQSVESLKKEISSHEKLESKSEYPRLCDIEFENDTEKWAFMRKLANKKLKQEATAPEMEILKKTNADLRAENKKLTAKIQLWKPKFRQLYKENLWLRQQLRIGRVPQINEGISGPTSITCGNLRIQTDSEWLQPKPEKM